MEGSRRQLNLSDLKLKAALAKRQREASEQMDDILLYRRLNNESNFLWASRTFLPSPYFVRGEAKDPKELIKCVLSSSNVKEKIRELALKNNVSEAVVTAAAEKILIELRHDFHMYAIRWFGLTLSKLAKTLYSGIQVKMNETKLFEIKEAYRNYPVILLPTHRSYVDFLLISYLSFHYDLTLPIIAAGMDFMQMGGVGELLRKSGAFFIRRTFGKDVLYCTCINQYVKVAALHGGKPVEMFIEGTRSRSGKSLQPKIGLLKAILESVLKGDVPDVYLLPIAVSYDRTLEEMLYAKELLGKPKPKESSKGLVKAIRWLGSQSYGSIFVNFGNPISFSSILKNAVSRSHSQSQNVAAAEPDNNNYKVFTEAVQEAAVKVIISNQQHLLVPIFSIVSLVFQSLISSGKTEISFNDLLNCVEDIEALLNANSCNLGYTLQHETLECNLRFILGIHSSLLTTNPETGMVCTIQNPDEVYLMVLQHYSNQCFSKLLPSSLILTLLYNEMDKQPTKLLLTEERKLEYLFFRKLLAQDFPYEETNVKEELDHELQVISSKYNSQTEIETEFVRVSRILRHGLEPFIIAYWGTLRTVVVSQIPSKSDVPFSTKQLCIHVQQFISLSLDSIKGKQYGALSLETIGNAIISLSKLGAIERKLNQDGTFSIHIGNVERLQEILKRVEYLLDFHLEVRFAKNVSNSKL